MALIYHITSADGWGLAQRLGWVEADSLISEGFIHCSRQRQLLAVAQRFFAGQTGLVVLAIDEAAVAEILVNEGPTAVHDPDANGPAVHDPFAIDVFPHVYGKIPVGAVVAWAALVPDVHGDFGWPAPLPHDQHV